MRDAPSLIVQQEEGQSNKSKIRFLLTHSIVNSRNNKPEGGPCSQSWSWPSLSKMDQAKACGDWGLFAWHPPEGDGCPALPLQTPPNLPGPTAFRWSHTAAKGALPGWRGWQHLFSLQQQHVE